MDNLPEPISKNDAVSAIVCGIAALAGLVMIVLRCLLE